MVTDPYDIFVSYSRAHREFVTQMVDQFRSRGWHVFQDVAELQVGEQYERRLVTAIDSCRCFVAVWSPEYLESKACEMEWSRANKRSIAKHDGFIFPVLLVDCDLPDEKRAIQWVDLQDRVLSGEAFQRLMDGISNTIATSRKNGSGPFRSDEVDDVAEKGKAIGIAAVAGLGLALGAAMIGAAMAPHKDRDRKPRK